MPVIFTREICMPEISTEFLFTTALEIQMSSLGDTPYGSRLHEPRLTYRNLTTSIASRTRMSACGT
jgi:hypothetical protein